VTKVSIDRLSGGAELCTWFEAAPLRTEGAAGQVVAHTLKMMSGLDSQGYFMLTKHVDVTFALFGLVDVGLTRFAQLDLARGMEIEVTESGITLRFGSVQGAQGWIKAKRIEVSFAVKPDHERHA